MFMKIVYFVLPSVSIPNSRMKWNLLSFFLPPTKYHRCECQYACIRHVSVDEQQHNTTEPKPNTIHNTTQRKMIRRLRIHIIIYNITIVMKVFVNLSACRFHPRPLDTFSFSVSLLFRFVSLSLSCALSRSP